MSNNLDKQYQALLQDILDNGHSKGDRTGTGTKSVFPRVITHNMAEGFPLLTTKKMYHKGIFTELLWLLRGDTNIKWLVENKCDIWTGDAYKKFATQAYGVDDYINEDGSILSKEQFSDKILNDAEFAEEWGDLGPIYGKQWRAWEAFEEYDDAFEVNMLEETDEQITFSMGTKGMVTEIDQISKALNTLINNPDCRRNIVNAWNVGEIDKMTLPPCHYTFQLWTRELTSFEREDYFAYKMNNMSHQERCELHPNHSEEDVREKLDALKVPRRAISLTWQQRSVDTFLGLPFNIASYGALLMIFGKLVNMVPETLTGVLGDTHLYNNHLEQAKEQIGRELSIKERFELAKENAVLTGDEIVEFDERYKQLYENGKTNLFISPLTWERWNGFFDYHVVPKRTREPFNLPNLRINTEFWNPENTIGTNWDAIIKGIELDDFQLENYKSHGTIKAPLSN